MGSVCELILEIVLTGAEEASLSNQVPGWVRFLLMAVNAFFFFSVSGLVLAVGISMTGESGYVGIPFVLLGLFMLGFSVHKVWTQRSRRKHR